MPKPNGPGGESAAGGKPSKTGPGPIGLAIILLARGFPRFSNGWDSGRATAPSAVTRFPWRPLVHGGETGEDTDKPSWGKA